MQVDGEFSELIGTIYQGPLEEVPWQSFLASFRELMGAHLVTLLLRPPTSGGHGKMLHDGGSISAIDSYNESLFALDPYVNLPLGEVVGLRDFVTPEVLENSDFYKLAMEPHGYYDFLGADLRCKNELDARLRIGRHQGAKQFGKTEKDIVYAVLPHLERAMLIHTRLNRMESERALYAGAVGQLSVGTVILDEQGKVLSCNELAEELLARNDGLSLKQGVLQLPSRDANKDLKGLIENVLASQLRGEPVAVEALRVPRPSGQADIGLLIREIPVSKWSEGMAVPSVAVFISDPERKSEAPIQVITELFGFTPTESSLAMLLANGLTLDEASSELGVSRNTTRTHLRSVFSKTGVTRQPMLVRLILKSVAHLA